MIKQSEQNTRFSASIIFVLIIISVWARSLGLNKGIWLDEYSSIEVIQRQGTFIDILRSYDHPPFYFLILKAWHILVGKSEPTLRLLSLAISIITQISAFYWLKSKSTFSAIIAVLLLSTVPLLSRYAIEIRQYQLLLCLTTLAFFISSRISKSTTKNPKGSYLLLATLLTLTVWTHLLGVFVIFMVLSYYFLEYHRLKKTTDIRWLIAVACPAFISFCYLYFIFLSTSDPDNWWMPYPSQAIVLGSIKSVVGIESLFLPIKHNLLPENIHKLYNLYVISLFAIIINFMLFGKWRTTYPLAIATLVYIVALYLVSVFLLPLFWNRMLLPILIPFIAFVSLQIDLKNHWLRLMATLSLLVLCASFFTIWVSYEAKTPIEAWRSASLTISEEIMPEDQLIIYPPYVQGPISFYSPNLFTSSENTLPLNPNLGTLEETTNALLTQSTGDLYLFVRLDSSISKHQEDYDKSIALLESQFNTETRYESNLFKLIRFQSLSSE